METSDISAYIFILGAFLTRKRVKYRVYDSRMSESKYLIVNDTIKIRFSTHPPMNLVSPSNYNVNGFESFCKLEKRLEKAINMTRSGKVPFYKAFYKAAA